MLTYTAKRVAIVVLLLSVSFAVSYADCPSYKFPHRSYPTRASVVGVFMDVCSLGTNSTACSVAQWRNTFMQYGMLYDVERYGEYAWKLLEYCTEDQLWFDVNYMINRCSCFASSAHVFFLSDMKVRVDSGAKGDFYVPD